MNQKKLRIAFVSSKRYSFYPPDYQGRGLGGTESALVLLTKSLARRGNHVDVYNCCYKPGRYDGVRWFPLWSFGKAKYDAVVSVRLLQTFNDKKDCAPIRAVWIHDETLPGATRADRTGMVNLWIAVSETQKKFIEKNETIKQWNWFITRNGLDTGIYSKELNTIKKNRGQMIYCSAPDRGLLSLLKMWPKIVKAVPNARLIVTGSWALWGNADEENDRIFKTIYRLAAQQKTVTLLKKIPKVDVALHQRKSQLMIYPTDFNEMFCISALECLSVGTPIISTNRAALKERVKSGYNGFLINGSPSEDKYRRQFFGQVVSLMRNRDVLKKLQNDAIKSVSNSSYDSIAQEWELKLMKRKNTSH